MTDSIKDYSLQLFHRFRRERKERHEGEIKDGPSCTGNVGVHDATMKYLS